MPTVNRSLFDDCAYKASKWVVGDELRIVRGLIPALRHADIVHTFFIYRVSVQAKIINTYFIIFGARALAAFGLG